MVNSTTPGRRFLLVRIACTVLFSVYVFVGIWWHIALLSAVAVLWGAREVLVGAVLFDLVYAGMHPTFAMPVTALCLCAYMLRQVAIRQLRVYA